MSNSYICTFVDPSSITCYDGSIGISASFPKENVLDYNNPLRPTKANTTTPAYINMKFYIPSAANTPILGVLVRDVNFGFMNFRTNAASNSFGSGDINAELLFQPAKDSRTGRYNALWTYASNANSLMTLSSTAVYWQINQSVTTPCFNPSDYASIGSIYFITRYDKINYDWQIPVHNTRTIPIQKTDRASGGAKVVTLGSPKMTFSVPTVMPTIATTEYSTGGEVQQYSWQEFDKGKGFLFWEFRTNEKLARIYHVRQSPEFSVSYGNVDTVMEASLELEEQV